MDTNLLTNNLFKVDFITKLNLLEYLAMDIQNGEPFNLVQLSLLKVYYMKEPCKKKDLEKALKLQSGALPSQNFKNGYLEQDEERNIIITGSGIQEAKRLIERLNLEEFKAGSENYKTAKMFLLYACGIDKAFEPDELVVELIIAIRVLLLKVFNHTPLGMPSISVLYYLYIFKTLTNREMLKYIPQRTIIQIQSVMKNSSRCGYIYCVSEVSNKKYELTDKGTETIEIIIKNANDYLDNYAKSSPTKAEECINAITKLNDLAGKRIAKKAIEENFINVRKR